MNHNKNFTMDGIGEDIFFLSNGHISPVWYSVLAEVDISQFLNFQPFVK